MDTFLESLPALKRVKKEEVPRDADRGYFIGVDGRPVLCSSQHKMLAGYLQNGEACVMKHANRLWRNEAKKLGILFSQVDFVHDEWQTEVPFMERELKEFTKPDGTKYISTDAAEELGRIQRESIVLTGVHLDIFCPLAGTTDIGFNWAETH